MELIAGLYETTGSIEDDHSINCALQSVLRFFRQTSVRRRGRFSKANIEWTHNTVTQQKRKFLATHRRCENVGDLATRSDKACGSAACGPTLTAAPLGVARLKCLDSRAQWVTTRSRGRRSGESRPSSPSSYGLSLATLWEITRLRRSCCPDHLPISIFCAPILFRAPWPAAFRVTTRPARPKRASFNVSRVRPGARRRDTRTRPARNDNWLVSAMRRPEGDPGPQAGDVRALLWNRVRLSDRLRSRSV